MNPANVLAYLAQIAIVVLICAGLPRLLGLRSPGIHYAFWRTVLVVCLLLPIVQPWQPAEMAFVPAPGPPPAIAGGPAPPSTPAPGPAGGIDWFAVLQIAAAVGLSVRLVWLALGAMRLRRLRRHATDAAIGFDDLKSAIGAAPPILWSADVRHPVTFGVFRPVILLPAAIKAIDQPAQRAIVAHELHHVRRRDWAWVIAEEVVRSAFWFHPAMWWLVSRVQLARETVVDELSILSTNARRTYLDTLLAFADDTGLTSSPAFSARRHLFHRVMLLSKEGGMSSIRIAVTSCALLAALAAGSWTAVSAFPLYGDAVVQDQAPPRDPIGPDVHARRAQEFWAKATRDTSLTREQQLDAVLKGIAAADRALAINPYHRDALIWKTTLLRLQALEADPAEREKLIKDAEMLRKIALALSEPPQPGANVMEFLPRDYKLLVDQLNPVRIGSGIQAPAKIRDVPPVYPPIAQASRVQGVVIIEAVIDEMGQVADARVLRSIPLLDQAALEAVRQWQYTPTLLNGQPKAVLMTLTVNFKLE